MTEKGIVRCAGIALLLVATGPAFVSAQEPEAEETPSEDGPEEEPAEGEAETSALEAEQAEAEREGAQADEPEAAPERESLDHNLQFGIRAGAGVPFVFALRYGGGPPCDTGGNPFCVFVGSGIVDIDLSFGVLPDLEITSMFRVGMIGVEPTQENNLQFGLGIRNYLAPEELFKFFLGARLMLDFTQPGGVAGWNDVDFGVRGEVGVQLDVVRYVGFYVQVGVNIMFLRAFGVSPDVTGGFQIRLP